eukprot:CAMPEP_0182420538 /NCGR_PEP_ID=MMETSP1167-20130531/5400_1 /TAXON_ID=2988 /ORGANISM="Mallomonas Sp, Strain CCMP3275" /LENGTH=217 /DNA_ID=CAMNT_0024596597 /DNA_START=193 /DNA_END=846 /DNA_ORIENTATION=-
MRRRLSESRTILNHKGIMRSKSALIQGSHYLKMPRITDASSGTVDKWIKRPGQKFSSSDGICQVTLDGLTVELNCGEEGYLAQILQEQGKEVHVEDSIAVYCTDRNSLMTFIQDQRVNARDDEMDALTKAMIEAHTPKSDCLRLLKEIRHLIKEGVLEEDSELCQELTSLARKSHPELLAVFEASLDRGSQGEETLDVKFFLRNAKDIIQERSKRLQ